MSKFIISILLIIIATLAAVLLIKDDPGLVLIQYANHSIETTLAVAIVTLILATVVLGYGFKILLFILRIRSYFAALAKRRRIEKSRLLLNKALIDLTEGRFALAETKLTQLIDYAENPLLNYLLAARCAHHQGKYDQRDDYLKQAYESNPDAQIAIGVTQGELQLTAKQTERAYATLTHLYQQSPKHDYVIKLLTKVYIELHEWDQLIELLPVLKKKKIFNDERLSEIEQQIYAGCFSGSCSTDITSLTKTYKKMVKEMPHNAALLQQYIEKLDDLDDTQHLVETTIRENLQNHWDSTLVIRYGKLDKLEASELLAHAEKWQEQHQFDADLLLTLGRLARKTQLWGKAQSYLEASISAQANPLNCLELADMLEKDLNKSNEAMSYYQQGLKTCVDDK